MSLTFEPRTCWPTRWCSCLVGDSWVNTKAWIWVIYEWVFLPFSVHTEVFSLRWVLQIWNYLTFNMFPFLSILLSSPQSSEQKQTPVSPGASLPVQPQTRTPVSTPFLFFYLSIQWSEFSQPFHLSPTPSALFRLFWCVTWSTWKHGHGAVSELLSEGWGSKSRARWHSAALCCCWEVKKSARVCVCVRAHDFKRWKGAWSECFAWTCEEFLFRNTKFSQSIQSVRAGHTDAEKPPTCPPSISFYIPRHSRYLCVSLQSVHPPCLISSPALSLSALPSFHSGFLFVLSSESPCQLRLKVETPSKLYSCLFWAAFK